VTLPGAGIIPAERLAWRGVTVGVWRGIPTDRSRAIASYRIWAGILCCWNSVSGPVNLKTIQAHVGDKSNLTLKQAKADCDFPARGLDRRARTVSGRLEVKPVCWVGLSLLHGVGSF
jgi:hypothetical protein